MLSQYLSLIQRQGALWRLHNTRHDNSREGEEREREKTVLGVRHARADSLVPPPCHWNVYYRPLERVYYRPSNAKYRNLDPRRSSEISWDLEIEIEIEIEKNLQGMYARNTRSSAGCGVNVFPKVCVRCVQAKSRQAVSILQRGVQVPCKARREALLAGWQCSTQLLLKTYVGKPAAGTGCPTRLAS